MMKRFNAGEGLELRVDVGLGGALKPETLRVINQLENTIVDFGYKPEDNVVSFDNIVPLRVDTRNITNNTKFVVGNPLAFTPYYIKVEDTGASLPTVRTRRGVFSEILDDTNSQSNLLRVVSDTTASYSDPIVQISGKSTSANDKYINVSANGNDIFSVYANGSVLVGKSTDISDPDHVLTTKDYIDARATDPSVIHDISGFNLPLGENQWFDVGVLSSILSDDGVYDFGLEASAVDNSVIAANINAPGSGYSVGDKVSLVGINGTGQADCVIMIDAVNEADGSVTAVSIYRGGEGYTESTNVATTYSGAGNSLSIDITAVSDNTDNYGYMMYSGTIPYLGVTGQFHGTGLDSEIFLQRGGDPGVQEIYLRVYQEDTPTSQPVLQIKKTGADPVFFEKFKFTFKRQF